MISSKSRLVSRNVARRLAAARLAARSSPAMRRLLTQQRFYTTEKVLEWRNRFSENKPKPSQTLYDAAREKENCGVGLIASLKSEPRRDIVEKADEMLVRMAHRGGCGCDPMSGDGSGTCFLRICESTTAVATRLSHWRSLVKIQECSLVCPILSCAPKPSLSSTWIFPNKDSTQSVIFSFRLDPTPTVS